MPLGRGRVWLLLVSFAAVVLGTSLLPYLFPPSRDILGVSAAVGFNNAVAYLWYVASVIVTGAVLARLLPARPALPWPSLENLRRDVPWRIVGAVAAIHVVAFAALFLYKGRFVFSEGLYFQALLHRMSFGEVPYVDFSYYYGPLMLYPGHWLGGLLGLELGYGVWFVASYVVGLVLLAMVLAAFLRSRPAVAWWFVLLAVGLVNPFTGVNFTFTRYLLATLVFLLATRLLRANGWSGLPVAVIGLAAAILYGFEVASLTLGGILLLTAGLAFRWPVDLVARTLQALGRVTGSPLDTDASARTSVVLARSVALFAASLGAAAAAFYALDPSGRALAGFADSSLAFLSGAHNQPIYPNLLFLTLVAVSALAVAVVLRTAASSSHALAATVGAYFGLALVAQRASFAATDYNHTIMFGLPALLLALSGIEYLTTPGRAAPRLGAAAILIAGFILPMQSYQTTQLFPSLLAGRSATSSGATTAPAVPIEEQIMGAVQEAGVDHPYVMYGLDYYSLPVYRRLGLRYAGYDTIFNSARTPALVDLQIDRVRRSKAYVVMTTADYENRPGVPRVDPLLDAYSVVTGAALPGSEVQRLNYESLRELQNQFFDFVRREYRPVVKRDAVVVLRPAG